MRLYDFALDRILQCILKGVDHINRFVREISYFVINAIFLTSAKIMAERSEEDQAAQAKVDKFLSFCDDLVPIVAKGLGDNWSQVRYAASQAVRAFYAIAKQDEALKVKFDPLLVPRMCLLQLAY